MSRGGTVRSNRETQKMLETRELLGTRRSFKQTALSQGRKFCMLCTKKNLQIRQTLLNRYSHI